MNCKKGHRYRVVQDGDKVMTGLLKCKLCGHVHDTEPVLNLTRDQVREQWDRKRHGNLIQVFT